MQATEVTCELVVELQVELEFQASVVEMRNQHMDRMCPDAKQHTDRMLDKKVRMLYRGFKSKMCPEILPTGTGCGSQIRATYVGHMVHMSILCGKEKFRKVDMGQYTNHLLNMWAACGHRMSPVDWGYKYNFSKSNILTKFWAISSPLLYFHSNVSLFYVFPSDSNPVYLLLTQFFLQNPRVSKKFSLRIRKRTLGVPPQGLNLFLSPCMGLVGIIDGVLHRSIVAQVLFHGTHVPFVGGVAIETLSSGEAYLQDRKIGELRS
ncbi:hypothetical protein HAX54_011889 [Datura stramonium]|uniref:Uncharacterized protein n=1 Tax=Datura stramonium TaxID=4076 RepID=A0ABS8Y0Q6_DATST|nr:hypothetical protein [Datura stramonium]